MICRNKPIYCKESAKETLDSKTTSGGDCKPNDQTNNRTNAACDPLPEAQEDPEDCADAELDPKPQSALANT